VRWPHTYALITIEAAGLLRQKNTLHESESMPSCREGNFGKVPLALMDERVTIQSSFAVSNKIEAYMQ